MRIVLLLAYLALTSIALAATPPKTTLLDLAKNKFAPRELTDAEQKLFTNTERGEPASALTGDDKEDNPDNASTWPDDRVIHAECLVWLCTDSEASKRVTYRGIEISGMRIDGKLDLAFSQFPFPLSAWKCAFLQEIVLQNAHFAAIDLEFTHVKNVTADGVKIDGNLRLHDNFKAQGEVNLLGATIGGSLDCEDAQLAKLQGKALDANRAKINGSVFLRHSFKAEGEVNFRLATIGGNLDCEGAQLTNAGGYALVADGAKINGGLYLRRGFKAIGEIILVGSDIGGDLDCDGAELSNPDGYGLDAARSTIEGGVYLRGHFKADGGVGFFASQVKSQFNWYNTLPAEHTWIDLRSAKVAALRDNESSWPVEGSLLLNGFAYDRIHEDSPVTAESRLRWLHRQRRDKFLPQPYEQLAFVLRNMGHEREARAVMIEKNRDHARYLAEHGGRSRFLAHEWWWYNVFGRLIGYGYAPSRAFFISVVMILFGWWLFRLGFNKKLISPTNDKAYKKDESGQFVLENGKRTISDEYPKFNAFVYSLESFTPLLKLDQSASWTPNANLGTRLNFCRLHLPTTGSLLRTYLWCHIIAGWVLTSLWVGALTGLVKS